MKKLTAKDIETSVRAIGIGRIEVRAGVRVTAVVTVSYGLHPEVLEGAKLAARTQVVRHIYQPVRDDALAAFLALQKALRHPDDLALLRRVMGPLLNAGEELVSEE